MNEILLKVALSTIKATNQTNQMKSFCLLLQGRRKKRYVLDEFDIDFKNLTNDEDFSNRGEKDQSFQITDTFKKLYMEERR